MARLLIIDDDIDTTEIWTDYFKAKGFDVFSANDTKSGITLAQSAHPDCILLDVRFDQEGDEAGYFACKKLREFYQEPILMLSAYKIDPLEKIQGLEFGATAYLEKTISLRELEGWVHAQIKSFGHHIYRIADGRVEVDSRSREVRVEGKALKLTQTEYKLIAFLCAHRGEPQSKNDLLELLYEDDDKATETRLTSHMYNLRKHIEIDPKKPTVILTVHGFGYKIS